MARVNHVVVINLHLICLLFGLVVFFTGMTPNREPCDVYYRDPLSLMGYLIISISILSLCGNYFSMKVLRWLYLLTILVAILGMTNKVRVGIIVFSPGSKYANTEVELHIGDFSRRLRLDIITRWSAIKACMVTSGVCIEDNINWEDLSYLDRDPDLKALGDFIFYYGSYPLQRKCCLPPQVCGFERRNGTLDWYQQRDHKSAETAAAGKVSSSVPVTLLDTDKLDCDKWGNNISQRCFDCDSCKAGFMEEVVWSWKRNFLLEMGFLTSLVLILGISIRATFSRHVDNINDDEESYHETLDNLPTGIICRG